MQELCMILAWLLINTWFASECIFSQDRRLVYFWFSNISYIQESRCIILEVKCSFVMSELQNNLHIYFCQLSFSMQGKGLHREKEHSDPCHHPIRKGLVWIPEKGVQTVWCFSGGETTFDTQTNVGAPQGQTDPPWHCRCHLQNTLQGL